MTPAPQPTFLQRLRYRFDNALSRGIWVVLAWLGLASLVFFLVVAAVIALTGVGPDDQPATFAEGVWLTLGRFLDAGTFTGDNGLHFRLLMLGVTVVGIFIAATIIGLISSGIDARIEALRRGRSLVIESGHTIVIGRSDKLATVISELVEANASERNRAVVVLTGDDTVEVSEDIRSQVRDMKTTRLVVRSGSAARIHDLSQVNPSSAKSVIVLRSADESDAHVVKTVLALTRVIGEGASVTIVAEVDDQDTAQALRAAVGDRLVVVTPTDIIARISAQVSRAAGLGTVYQELLDFDGDEMYLIDVPEAWRGRTYGEALLSSTASTIIGVRQGDATTLNPPMATVLTDGDQLIGISEDDSTFVLDVEPSAYHATDPQSRIASDRQVERTLIVGWSELAPLIAAELESHVADGSQLHVLVDPELHDPAQVQRDLALDNHALTVHAGDPIRRSDMDVVLASGAFDHIMLLSERDSFEMSEADARTLLTLLHVQGLLGDGAGNNVVAELLDPSDVELAGGDSGDFIVSQKLISLLIAQLSEAPTLADVFADLFDSDGATIALVRADTLVTPGEMSFGHIVDRARAMNATAIGYRTSTDRAHASALAGGVRVNPPKDESVTLQAEDAIIVITR